MHQAPSGGQAQEGVQWLLEVFLSSTYDLQQGMGLKHCKQPAERSPSGVDGEVVRWHREGSSFLLKCVTCQQLITYHLQQKQSSLLIMGLHDIQV